MHRRPDEFELLIAHWVPSSSKFEGRYPAVASVVAAAAAAASWERMSAAELAGFFPRCLGAYPSSPFALRFGSGRR